MRVLVCAPMFLKQKMGTRFRALELSKALAKAGAEVHVAAYNIPDSESITFHKLPKPKRTMFGGFSNQVISLIKIIEEVKPDIIYAQTQWGMFPSVIAGRLSHIPVVTDIHSSYLEDFSLLRKAYGKGSKRYFLREKQESLFLSQCAALTAVSTTVADMYGKSGKQVFVIRSGIDPKMFGNKEKAEDIEKIRKGRVIVGYVGNFNPYQGVDMLLESAREILKEDKDYLFVFVGGNPSALGDSLEGLPKGNLKFVGPVEHSQVPKYLNSFDILVIPRPWSQLAHFAFPYKLVEYMGSGKPVVATDISDHGKLINKDTGILIKPEKKELTEALRALKDKKLRERLGRNAQEFVFKEYNWDMVGAQLKEVLAKFAKN